MRLTGRWRRSQRRTQPRQECITPPCQWGHPLIPCATWGALSLDDPRLPAALLAREVVQRALQDELRMRRGETYGVWLSDLAAVEPDIFTIMSTAAPERVAEHVAATRVVLARVHSAGLTAEEVDRSRALLRTSLLHQTHTPLLTMARAVNDAVIPGGFSHLAGLTAKAVDAPLEQVDVFAREFFAPDAFAELRILPKGAQ